MVGYCENDVDCRRFLQLVHFGEKFDSFNCRKTCDNCLNTQTLVDKDVTQIAKQLVELVKSVWQQFSASYILDVYRGSMSQIVKRNKHDTLKLHGAGKHIAKGEASRVLRHLVVEEILGEDVKKSDLYGSVSSVLKVNETKAGPVLAGRQNITLRFPSTAKASKPSKNDATTARSSLTSLKQNLGQADAPTSVQPQPEVNLDLSAKLFSALRILRTHILKEAGDRVMAYHIFSNAILQNISRRMPRTKEELLEINGVNKAKVNKYGDKVLETIEATINENHGTTGPGNKKNKHKININISSFAYERQPSLRGGGDGNSSDSVKRRRNTIKDPYEDSRDDDDDEDFVVNTARSKKRVLEKPNPSVDYFDEIPDEDLYFYGSGYDVETNASNQKDERNNGGRVLPCW